MHLYLVQHGEAHPAEVDPDRSLNDQGRRDVQRLAGLMQQAGVSVARVVHSGKARARETAEILSAVMAPGVSCEAETGLRPNDPPAAFANAISDWQEDSLVVGHLPFMAGLVAYLLGCDEDRYLVEFLPGSMACLVNEDGDEWRLAWLVRPELLA